MSNQTAIALLTALWLLIWLGECIGKDEIRKEAVMAGAAEYVSDKDGSLKFHWKEKP